MEKERSAKLASIVTTVIADGTMRVNPADCFMKKAQTTSNRPATIKATHAIRLSTVRAGPSRT